MLFVKKLIKRRKINKAHFTPQKMKFSIKDFFSKCDQTHSFLRIWSHWLKKSLMQNLIFLCSAFWEEWPWEINFHLYLSFIFHSQINRNCKKYIILITLIFSQFTPIYVPKNLSNAPVQVLSQLHHWFCREMLYYHS